jgi:hypothetical protein
MNTQKKVIQLKEASTNQVAIKDLFPDSNLSLTYDPKGDVNEKD